MSRANDTPEERARVFSRIAPLILQFRDAQFDSTFHMEELRRYCIDRDPSIAPDSPSRILRELRIRRMLNYVVINRRQSLYQFRPLAPVSPPPEADWYEAKQSSFFEEE